jgi:hypothetical protein
MSILVQFLALPYGWPLTIMFGGLGVWWALGLSGLSVHMLAIPMVWQLVRDRKRVRIPRGFGIWVIFLVWSAASVVMLETDPLGTIPDSAFDRMLPFAFRLISYLAAAVIVVYTVNLDRQRYSQRKIAQVLGVGFIWVALGGFLGMFAPRLEFTSPVEMILPRSLTNVEFIASLVHPTAAQIQDFLGYGAARPAAPFGFTNMWGHTYALLLPWFVVAFIVLVRRGRRLLGLVFLGASLVPAIASLNRGLWLGLGLTAAYVVLRQLFRGRVLGSAAVLAGGIVALTLFTLSPLNSLVQQRLETGHSNTIRAYSTEYAIELATRSPVIGFGNTRTALGSVASIAVGKTPTCPACGNVSIGINGQFWFEIVAHGFVGAALYVGTFLYLAWRFRGDNSPIGIAGQLSVLLMLWFMFIYGALPTPLAIAFIAWAVLLRNQTNPLDTS